MRSATWYAQALRRDGGLFRDTYTDFNTKSFAHATSGAACAGIFLYRMVHEHGFDQFLEPADSALKFYLDMQINNPTDPNLQGAILEKILPPDGTDRHPYHLRDLGTIFFVQLVAQRLEQLA